MVDSINNVKSSKIVAAAMAELKTEKVKEATAKLKKLYVQRNAANKVVRNLDREIEDYLAELEIDDEDANDE